MTRDAIAISIQAGLAPADDRAVSRLFVRDVEELPGHYPHGYVTRLEGVGRDGGGIDLDKRRELRLGPYDLLPLTEPPSDPHPDHAAETTRQERFTPGPLPRS